jgi:hypothetical protein
MTETKREEVQSAAQEMIDAVETYSAAAAFEFIQCSEAQPGYAFPDRDVFERWLSALEPEAIEEVRAKGDIPDLVWSAQKIGFYIGIFVGAKSMGASRQELEKRAQCLIERIV